MLKFVSSYLALSYLAFATLVVAGLLQIVAAWRLYAGLALLDYRRRPAWRHACGPALVALAYGWFFGTRRELLTPGPAGAELTILFGASVLLALAATLLGASALRPFKSAAGSALSAGVRASAVELGQGLSGVLYVGPDQEAPRPGVCLVPDPGVPHGQWEPLAAELAAQGYVVLVPAWTAAWQRYPDVLALVPQAMAFLSGFPQVDGSRLIVAGTGLGGDLAVRAAAGDRSIVAAVALAPLLEEQNARPGLGLLHEMTYLEAVRWDLRGRRRELLRQLGTWEAIGHLGTRPTLILYGGRDALVPVLETRTRLARHGPAVEVRAVADEGHLSLAT
ncbi:MAG: acetylxylan esterase, partial [Anaerolineae bacterium]|nr:acetylxylan esterase [Anaerolineae bacterium]